MSLLHASLVHVLAEPLPRWANDTTTLQLYYPTIKRAAMWQMDVSSSFGVPTKLQTTYGTPIAYGQHFHANRFSDILGFPKYEIGAYASVFHIAALAAWVAGPCR